MPETSQRFKRLDIDVDLVSHVRDVISNECPENPLIYFNLSLYFHTGFQLSKVQSPIPKPSRRLQSQWQRAIK